MTFASLLCASCAQIEGSGPSGSYKATYVMTDAAALYASPTESKAAAVTQSVVPIELIRGLVALGITEIGADVLSELIKSDRLIELGAQSADVSKQRFKGQLREELARLRLQERLANQPSNALP